jgi:hypothetical protein
MDQRCELISERRKAAGGRRSAFDPALRERWQTLNRLILGNVYTLLEVALNFERTTTDEAEFQSMMADVKRMGPKEACARVLSKARHFIRNARGWGGMYGACKV